MKKLVALILLFNLVAAFAETKVYDDGKQLNGVLLSEYESRELYEGLNVTPHKGRSGTAKFFYTKDQKTSIYCTHSKMSREARYSCSFSIVYAGAASKVTPVFRENGSLHASINDPGEAESLYKALNFQTLNGRSGTAQFFFTEDRKASVYCTESSISSALSHSCRISIANP